MQSEAGLLHAQLRRMRAMDYRYHSLFFRYINLWILICATLLVISLLPPLQAAVLLVPHLILYAAMQGAFHFHYMLFAKRYARAIERRLNAVAGHRVLIANELEAAAIFPVDGPRFVGFSFARPASFFSAITLHYGIAGTLLWFLALYRASQVVPPLTENFPPLASYLPVTLAWTVLNMIYLWWYFAGQRDQASVEPILSSYVEEMQ